MEDLSYFHQDFVLPSKFSWKQGDAYQTLATRVDDVCRMYPHAVILWTKDFSNFPGFPANGSPKVYNKGSFSFGHWIPVGIAPRIRNCTTMITKVDMRCITSRDIWSTSGPQLHALNPTALDSHQFVPGINFAIQSESPISWHYKLHL